MGGDLSAHEVVDQVCVAQEELKLVNGYFVEKRNNVADEFFPLVFLVGLLNNRVFELNPADIKCFLVIF